VEDEVRVENVLRVDPASERGQLERLAQFKAARSGELVASHLATLGEAAQGSANLLPVIREALRARATVGEVCRTLYEVFGGYQPI
jgi:methylmalonyl-CoA mutase N-terminal domain/subunit